MNTQNNRGVAAMSLFIAIPVLILIAGVIWKIASNDSPEIPANTEVTATSTSSSTKSDERENKPVQDTSNGSAVCGGRTQVERLNCLFETAVKQKNSSLCLQLQNPSKDICLQQVGMNSVNDSVCAKISKTDLRDMCYRYVGIQKLDTSICKKIVTREETDECYLRIAQITKDAKLCINVQTMERRNECLKIDPANRGSLQTGQ